MSIVASRVVCLASLVLCVASAHADDDTLSDLLIEKGYITEEELEEAKAAAGDSADDSIDVFQAEPEAKPEPTFGVGTKGLWIQSADKRFKLTLGGRLQVDGGGFSGGTTPLGDGIRLRRGRIITYGHMFTDWSYKFEVNFDGDGRVFPTDAWMAYDGFDRVVVRIGHQKVPFSQSSMSSSNWQVFQERALNDSLIDTAEEGRRRMGALIGTWGDHYNLYAGVFGEGLTDPGRADSDWGTAIRLQVAPLASERRVAAVAGSFYFKQFKSASELRYQSKPESSLASVSLVDTGVLTTVGETLSYNADATFVLGSAHAQGEYIRSNVRRNFGSELVIDGWYIQGGYFLTGENRRFNVKTGKFVSVRPKRKIGAWEIAARYSTLDLEDKDVSGGREKNIGAALNWYANESVMFRFNYIRAYLEPNSANLANLNPPLVGGIDEIVNAYMVRAQIVF